MGKKTALITGASRGIGYEFANLMAKEGYDLILTARSRGKFYAIKEELEEQYGNSVYIIPVDLTIPHVAEEIFYVLARKNVKVDVLINNAGFGDYGKFTDTDIKNELQMIQLNIVTLTHLSKLFLKQMVERNSGRILNVASIAAFQPGPLMSVFYATQAYVLYFSEALASELKGTDVTITTLCPGPTETGFQAVAHMENARIMQNRKLATPKEVAEFGYKAMLKGKPVAVHGLTNQILANSPRLFPRQVMANLVHYMHQGKN